MPALRAAQLADGQDQVVAREQEVADLDEHIVVTSPSDHSRMSLPDTSPTCRSRAPIVHLKSRQRDAVAEHHRNCASVMGECVPSAGMMSTSPFGESNS